MTRKLVRVNLPKSVACFSSLLPTVRRPGRRHITHTGVSAAQQAYSWRRQRAGSPPCRPVRWPSEGKRVLVIRLTGTITTTTPRKGWRGSRGRLDGLGRHAGPQGVAQCADRGRVFTPSAAYRPSSRAWTFGAGWDACPAPEVTGVS